MRVGRVLVRLNQWKVVSLSRAASPRNSLVARLGEIACDRVEWFCGENNWHRCIGLHLPLSTRVIKRAVFNPRKVVKSSVNKKKEPRGLKIIIIILFTNRRMVVFEFDVLSKYKLDTFSFISFVLCFPEATNWGYSRLVRIE